MGDPLIFHRLNAATVSFGCMECPHLSQCGGLMRRGGGWDCFEFCCNAPEKCDRVCPRRPDDFAISLAEVRGFGLNNIGPLAVGAPLDLPPYIPVIHGGAGRNAPLLTPWAALPIDRVCTRKNRRQYKSRFASKREYLDSFRLGPDTRLAFLAIAKDRYLERYWASKNDAEIPRRLATAGFDVAVAPNYSWFLDEPRTQHMHARKRSLLCASEFAHAGVTPIVYLHALSEADWQLLGDFLRERKDVDLVCKEFQTGGASVEQGRDKIQRVAALEQRVGRRLHLVAVGAARFVPTLHRYLRAWTVVDSVPYMRSVKRRRICVSAGRLRWIPARSEPLDQLLIANLAEYELWIRRLRNQAARVA